MSRLMLDTSGYAAFKRGHPDAVAALQSHAELYLSTIVLGELWAGFAVGSRQGENRKELAEFMNSPRVEVVAIEEETAERYAQIYQRLRSAGRPIPTNDLWIAASAMEYGAKLLTLDQHYLHVTEILLAFLKPSSV